MPTTLAVGLQKKVGLPDYGSLGASVHLEFEIDRGLLEQDPDGFQRKVSEAFAACRKAVHSQLATATAIEVEAVSSQAGNPLDRLAGRSGPTTSQAPPPSAHPQLKSQPRTQPGTITQSQLRAIFAISRRQRLDLATLVRERFQVERPEALSIREASALIDELKRGTAEVRP